MAFLLFPHLVFDGEVLVHEARESGAAWSARHEHLRVPSACVNRAQQKHDLYAM